ncbi:hypothetical protein GCK32_011075, partial [Trichostrongylus colubriformis]
ESTTSSDNRNTGEEGEESLDFNNKLTKKKSNVFGSQDGVKK